MDVLNAVLPWRASSSGGTWPVASTGAGWELLGDEPADFAAYVTIDEIHA